MSIELHCHTVFSVDARGTPEELVDLAVNKGVTALSVTEHNDLRSFERAQARANHHGIRYFAGIELDAEWNGVNYHFLGLGFDPENPALRALAEKQSSVYTERFDLFSEYFEEYGYRFSRQALVEGMIEYYPTNPAPVLNQWYARDWLVENGVFPDKKTYQDLLGKIIERIVAERGAEAIRRFSRYEVVRDAVQNAGGVLLLAHVARYRPGDARRQIALIRELLDAGMDGFELYHPANVQDKGFAELAGEAESLDCLISGGSDSHNVPGANRWPIGSCRAPDSLVEGIEEALEQRQIEKVS